MNPAAGTMSNDVGEACEDVELTGHIIDSLILPKILDRIWTTAARFRIKQIAIGQARQRSQLRRAASPRRRPPRAGPDPGARSPTTAPCRRRCRIAAWWRPISTAPFPRVSTAPPTSAPRSAWTASGSPVERPGNGLRHSRRSGRAQARCVPMNEMRAGPADRRRARWACASFPSSDSRGAQAFELHGQHRLDGEAQGARHPRDRPRSGPAPRAAAGRSCLSAGPAIVHTGSGEFLCQRHPRRLRRRALRRQRPGHPRYRAGPVRHQPGRVSRPRGAWPKRGTSTTSARSTAFVAPAESARPSRRACSPPASCTSASAAASISSFAGSIRDDGPLPEVITDVLDAQQQCGRRSAA